MDSVTREKVRSFFVNASQSGRISIINIASVIYLGVLAGTNYDYQSIISPWVFKAHAVAAIAILCNMIVFEKMRNVKVGATILIFWIFLIHMVNVNFMGGISTPHYAWILLIPILAGATVGWKGQVFFFALTALGTIYYYVFPEQIAVLPYEDGSIYILSTWLLSLFVCSFIMISYHLTLDQKVVDLNAVLKRASFESKLFLGVFNTNTQNVLLVNEYGIIVRANVLAHETFGFPPGMLINKPLGDICKQTSVPFFVSSTQEHNDSREQKITLLSGNDLWFESNSVTVAETQRESITILVLEDITQRKNHESQLFYLAHYDALTKLPNRILAQDRLSELITFGHRHNDQFAVLFIDLDKFKSINDTAGHDVGDLVLIEVTRRIQSFLEKSDMIARFGGDEFVVLLDHMDQPEQIKAVFEKIQTSLSRPIVIEEHEYFVSSSVGIARFPVDGVTAAELLRKADIAMFNAKKNGGNSFEFYDELQSDHRQRNMKINAELNYAIDRGELALVFQPIVNDDKQTMGAEALLRWKNEMLGDVSPEEFIPICEESGLIVTIGHWVLNEACRTLKEWHLMGLEDIFISVNISYRQMYKTDLVSDIGSILNAHDLDGKFLALELTERVFADDIELVQRNIKQLNKLGVKTAIDDFGVDYSSFGYLKDTAFSTIKIDKSFVQDIAHSASAVSLCEGISSMARSLDLQVVAEGVETQEQWDILRELQIDLYQGYYFSRPLRHGDFEQAMKTEQKAIKLTE